jgi:alpha-beta hydrolase superfamily lysophospholipase
MALLRIALSLALLTAGVPHALAQSTPARTARAAVAQEIVTLGAGDGLQVPGLMTMPAVGAPSGGPIVIHLPEGPGGGPLRAGDPARFLATGLARAGYPNLSIETRHSMQYPFSRFEEAFADVKAAVDMAASRGFASVILSGNGLGGLLAVRYAAEAGDARIKAVMVFAPPADLAPAWRAKVGEEVYARTVERATKAISDGGPSSLIDLGDGLIFTPAAFLDWYGPEAKTSLTARIGALDKPLLLAAGSDDPAVPAGRLQRLVAQAAAAKPVSKVYPGAGHDFAGARDRVIADAAAWLASTGLPPIPRVVTTVVDVTTADGVPLSGILYAPATPRSASARRPTFMIVHSWTSDVMRSASHWLGMRLAQEGYTALAVRTRTSGFRNTVSGKLEDIPRDLRAWADFLAKRGSGRLIGIGHSVGGLWLSTYLSESQDERFEAAIYLGPTRDLPAHARTAMGEETYARVVKEAEDAVKAGKGSTTLINVPFPQARYEDDSRQPMFLPPPGSGFTYYYADTFLSYWGPDSLAVHRERVAEMKIPVLAIGGSRDPMMQGAWLLQFIRAAGGPGASIFYGGPNGASGSFDGYEARVIEDIIGWTEKLP